MIASGFYGNTSQGTSVHKMSIHKYDSNGGISNYIIDQSVRSSDNAQLYGVGELDGEFYITPNIWMSGCFVIEVS